MSLENVCIYLRKSRADREAEAHGEGETLARHEKILLDLAKGRGYSVGAIYREIVSGETISARPAMQQLLKEVEAGMWDGVLVVEVERLARGDTIDQGVVSRAFQFSDTKIITPTKTYDPNNEFDEEYFEFGLFMSRREYKTIKRRLNAGRASSAKEGKYCGNKPPYGYRRVKLENEKGWTLEIEPEQAAVVKLIYEWYVYGIDGERIGMVKIVRKLNEMGLKTMYGGSWVLSTVQSIIRNPVYAGMIRWNSRKSVRSIQDGKIIISRPMAEEYILSEGRHPAIVSKELFNQAQKIVDQNPARPVSSLHVIKNPLAGIVRCGKCGHTMTRKAPSARQGALLQCPYTSCPTVSSKLSLVEKSLIYGIQKLVDGYRLNDDSADQEFISAIKTKQGLLDEKKSEMKKIEKKKERQYDLLEQGVYSTEVFIERSQSVSAELTQCLETIHVLEEDLKKEQERFEQQNSFIPRCEDLLEHYWTWDVSTRNQFLQELIEKVVYNKDIKDTKKCDEITFTLDIYPRIRPK